MALTRVGPCFISGGPLAFTSVTDVTVSLQPVAYISTMATEQSSHGSLERHSRVNETAAQLPQEHATLRECLLHSFSSDSTQIEG